MNAMHEDKKSVGADLVIPLMALAFAAYFFVSIAGLSWEASANGIIIGTLLVLLVVLQVARIAWQVIKGRADLGMQALWAPRAALGKRLAMVAITILFIVTLKWLGLTLGLLLGMLAALWAMGVRRWKPLLGVSFTTAAAAYLLFIAALNSNFPHGPVERLLKSLF